MMVRANKKFYQIMQRYKEHHNSDCFIIYSMWDGYLNQPNNMLKVMMEEFENTLTLHTSGHATRKTIREVCNAVCPTQAVIPMHSSNPAGFETLGIIHSIRYLNDGEVYYV